MECNAKHGKMVDGQWKMYTAGHLRLYRNKINLTQQKLVIRNNMGKVLFNVGIQKGMKFMKQVSQKKGSVTFVACEDRERGMEKFAVSVKAQDIEQLFTTLESMAKV
jgi:tRNA G46 methylase TrmB